MNSSFTIDSRDNLLGVKYDLSYSKDDPSKGSEVRVDLKYKKSGLKLKKKSNDQYSFAKHNKNIENINNKIRYLSQYLFNYTDSTSFNLSSSGKLTIFMNEAYYPVDNGMLKKKFKVVNAKAKDYIKGELEKTEIALQTNSTDQAALNKKTLLVKALNEFNKDKWYKKSLNKIGSSISSLWKT